MSFTRLIILNILLLTFSWGGGEREQSEHIKVMPLHPSLKINTTLNTFFSLAFTSFDHLK